MLLTCPGWQLSAQGSSACGYVDPADGETFPHLAPLNHPLLLLIAVLHWLITGQEDFGCDKIHK